MVDEPTSAEWVIGEWVTLDRELHPFEALELATVIEAVKLHVLHGWPRWWAWRGCPKRSGKSVATPARLWYQSGVFKRRRGHR